MESPIKPTKKLVAEDSIEVRRRLKLANDDISTQAMYAVSSFAGIKSTDKRDQLARAQLVLEVSLQIVKDYSEFLGIKTLLASILSAYDLYKPKLGTTKRSRQNSFLRAIKEIEKAGGIVKYLNPKPSFGNSNKYESASKKIILDLAYTLWNTEQRPSWRKVHRDLPLLLQSLNMQAPNYNTFKQWVRSGAMSKYNFNRIGSSTFNRTYTPALKLTPPSHASDVWQIDASRFSKPWWNEKERRHQFETICFVIDVFSRKIVGVSIGPVEDHNLVIRAIKNAVLSEGILPGKIIGDRASAYKHEVARNFFLSVKTRLGVTFEMTPPNSPESKAVVEGIFGITQGVFNQIPGYIGKGVRTKSPDSRLSPEAHTKSLSATNRWSREEVLDAAYRVIIEYNNSVPTNALTSPNMRFASAARSKAVPVSIENQAMIFWYTFERKKVKRGTIEIVYKGNEYRFRLDDVELWARLQGTYVTVKIDIDEEIKSFDWGIAFIFSNGEFVGTATRLLDVSYEKENRDTSELEIVQSLKTQRREFKNHAVQFANSRKDTVSGVFGDIDLNTHLQNRKEQQYSAQDKANLNLFKDQNGVTSRDNRYGKIHEEATIIPLAIKPELTTDQEWDDTNVPMLAEVKLGRWEED